MSRPDDGGLKILVAEDHPANQSMLRTVLQALDGEPHIVGDGAAAVAAAAEGEFDLVLTDLAIPVLDGVAAIRAIRADERRRRRPRTPIYVISSQTGPRDLWASRAAGADGHLAKPLSISDLLVALQDGRRSRNARRRQG